MHTIEFKHDSTLKKQVSEDEYKNFLEWSGNAQVVRLLFELRGTSQEELEALEKEVFDAIGDEYCEYLLYEVFEGGYSNERNQSVIDRLRIRKRSLSNIKVLHITLKGYEDRINEKDLKEAFLKRNSGYAEILQISSDGINNRADEHYIIVNRESADEFDRVMQEHQKWHSEQVEIVQPQFNRLKNEIGGLLYRKFGVVPDEAGFVEWFVKKYVGRQHAIIDPVTGMFEMLGIINQSSFPPMVVDKNLYEYCLLKQENEKLILASIAPKKDEETTVFDFVDLLSEQGKKLLPSIKSEYVNPKPARLTPLLFALIDFELFDLNQTSRTQLHGLLEKEFGNIGTRQGLNTSINNYERSGSKEETEIRKAKKYLKSLDSSLSIT